MKYLLVLCYCTLMGCTTAQVSTPLTPLPISDEVTFPESWMGIYRGNLDIYTAKGSQQTVVMELEITPIDSTDRWAWAITYGPDSIAGRRSYELIILDPSKGHYQIDEKNSIVLDAFLRGDTFVSRFAVMGSLLDCTYEKAGDEIIFTIIMGKETTLLDTGGGIVAGDTIPVVNAYPVSVVQRGKLRKIN